MRRGESIIACGIARSVLRGWRSTVSLATEMDFLCQKWVRVSGHMALALCP